MLIVRIVFLNNFPNVAAVNISPDRCNSETERGTANKTNFVVDWS